MLRCGPGGSVPKEGDEQDEHSRGEEAGEEPDAVPIDDFGRSFAGCVLAAYPVDDAGADAQAEALGDQDEEALRLAADFAGR